MGSNAMFSAWSLSNEPAICHAIVLEFGIFENSNFEGFCYLLKRAIYCQLLVGSILPIPSKNRHIVLDFFHIR